MIRLDEGYRLDELHRLDEPPHLPAPVTPVTPPKEKGRHMDYISYRRADRKEFYQNLSDNIAVEGPKFGLTVLQCTDTKSVVDAILASMGVTDTAQNGLDSAKDLEQQSETANQALLRANVRNWKTLPGYAASGSEAVLRLKGAAVAFDPNTFKPKLKATVKPGEVVIGFEKGGADGVVIYCRIRGTLPWRKLAIDMNAPYNDTAPLATPNIPEVREYMARGILNDVEIGLESDIVTATFAG
jgi:hypothetical protein